MCLLPLWKETIVTVMLVVVCNDQCLQEHNGRHNVFCVIAEVCNDGVAVVKDNSSHHASRSWGECDAPGFLPFPSFHTGPQLPPCCLLDCLCVLLKTHPEVSYKFPVSQFNQVNS